MTQLIMQYSGSAIYSRFPLAKLFFSANYSLDWLPTATYFPV